jgi:hypothetical protein
VTSVWWCAAGALTVVSAALCRRQVTILSAANPTVRLRWIGRPANRPRSAKVLGFFAPLSGFLTVRCIFAALGRPHLYDVVLWSLSLGLIVVVVAAVPQARHNRRVRRVI